jgi:hypothetical protein
MKRVGDLSLILLPATHREFRYIHVLTSRHKEVFTTPMRCTHTTVPADVIGLFFAARLARNLGENKVIVKHVDRTFFANDIPQGIRKLTAEIHLTGTRIDRLPILIAKHRDTKCELW